MSYSYTYSVHTNKLNHPVIVSAGRHEKQQDAVRTDRRTDEVSACAASCAILGRRSSCKLI